MDCQIWEYGEHLALIWDVADDMFPTGYVDDLFSAYSNLVVSLASSQQNWDTVLPLYKLLTPPSHI